MSRIKHYLEIGVLASALAILAYLAPADAQQSNPGVQQSGAVANNDCVKWGPGVGRISSTGAPCPAAPPSAADPTATAGPAAVNGVASTYMRSDAAPAVQKGTNAQFGIVQSDGTTINCTTGLCTVAAITIGGQSVSPGGSAVVQGNGGKVQLSTGTATSGDCVRFDANGNTIANGAACATQSSGANPSATASDTAVNGVATTFMRSDAAPAVQKATDAAFGVMRGNGAQISCTAGVCTAQINSILPTPTRAGDILYWNGSAWTTIAGNNSGTRILSEDASGVPSWSSAGAGDVAGPASATDNAAARFDTTTGKLLQNSALIIADTTGSLSRNGGGGIPLEGTNTNDSAAAGYVGELIQNTNSASLTSGSSANCAQITLTAGDWDIYLGGLFSGAGATTTTQVQLGINTTSATLPGGNPPLQMFLFRVSSAITDFIYGPSVGPYAVSIASSTTYYGVSQATFSVSTYSASCRMRARRIR